MNIKTAIKEWLKTFSNKPSILSSTRLERFGFITISDLAVISCVVYEIYKDKLTATEVVILITPLLLAAGYNLTLTKKEQKDEKNNDSFINTSN